MIYDRWNHSKAPPKKPPLLSYNIIRPDTNFWTSSPKSAPSKIKTKRNGITYRLLPQRCLFLKQYTISSAPFRDLPLVRLFMHFPASKRRWRLTCPIMTFTFKMSTKHLTLCFLSFYGSLTGIWSYAYIYIYWVLITINIYIITK